MRTLLIEDDRAIASSIHAGFTQAGHRVHVVRDGVFATGQLTRQIHDLVIPDLGLPGIDGMMLLSQFQARDRVTPVLILIARDGLFDKVNGLNAGTDDYLFKSFEMPEPVARVGALLRRRGDSIEPVTRPDTLVERLRMSGVEQCIFVDVALLEPSPCEFAVLELLMLCQGRMVSEVQLQDRPVSFGHTIGEANHDVAGDTAIEVYIRRARRKAEYSEAEIVTVRGSGYLLQARAAVQVSSMFKRHCPALSSASATPAKGGNGAISLCLHLLRALVTPLSGLIVGTDALSYRLAAHYTAQVSDRALVGVANTLAEQLCIADLCVSATELYDIALTARTLVQNSGEDHIYWCISGSTGTLAGRDTPLGYGSGQVYIGDACVLYSWIDGKQVCVVYLLMPGMSAEVSKLRSPRQPVPPDSKDDVTRSVLAPTLAQAAPAFNPSNPPDAMQAEGGTVVEMAELLDHRDTAAKEVLLSVSILLIALLTIGGLILSLVLKEELQPSQTPADMLNKQSTRSVTPLLAESAERVPAELQPLINAVNALPARLRDALEAQRTFTADVAHQLRTPPMALKLHADRVVDAKTLDDTRLVLFELQSGASRAVRLPNQLLTLARAEPGMTSDQLGTPMCIDLVSLVFDTGAEWVPRVLARGLNLGLETWPHDATPPDSLQVPVLANAMLLRGTINNLLDNTIKYIPTGGRIILRTGVEAGAVSKWWGAVSVEGNGPGIPPERRGEVFQRFFRGDADHRPGQPQGSGLGLATARDIVHLHGGAVAIDDATTYDGSCVMCFVSRLPLADDVV